MRAPTRHARLAAAACRMYGVAIWMYPAGFRREFGHELAVTFRNRVEEVLDGGGLLDCLAFAVHIAVDCIRTFNMLAADALRERTPSTVSVFGLSEGGVARVYGQRPAADVPLMFALVGFAVAFFGWYWIIAVLPSYGV